MSEIIMLVATLVICAAVIGYGEWSNRRSRRRLAVLNAQAAAVLKRARR